MLKSQIHHFDDYKEYLRGLIENSPNKGRGQYKKISEFLGVHSTLVSQILSGHKDFSLEQAYLVADYFKLNQLEKDYFLQMVHLAKAGTMNLKSYYQEKLEILKERFTKVSSRVKAKKTLDENQKAIYYSDWLYMAIWLSTSLKTINYPEEIAEHFNIDPLKASQIIEFLLENGLIKEEDGSLKMGVARTHLDSSSPLIKRHHTNWRLKAVENFENLRAEELAFSAPLSISKKDFKELKSMILDFIESASKKVKKTNPELVACLNIDLFKM